MSDARRVAIVKSAGRADAFADAVRGAGFVPVLVSPFRCDPVEGSDEALRAALAGATWIAVTSPHAAAAMEQVRDDARRLRIAAVGAGTASALQASGYRPVIVGDMGGEALARKMVAAGAGRGDVVVHPCGRPSRPELGQALVAEGADVRAVEVYEMVPDPAGERAAAGVFACVVVGSPRLAERAAEIFPSRPPAVAVGRTTAAALRDVGWQPAAVAATPSPPDVAEAVRAAVGRGS
ncbi:MAG: hypothetical protein HMLKMBBP_01820 [Planctomycetes bacterium]|nr:hypothetical protein [Planctomycetota bacterium]